MRKEASLPFEADQFKSFPLTSLSYLFGIETNRMKTLQCFRKFLYQGCLPHTGESCDEDILLYQPQRDPPFVYLFSVPFSSFETGESETVSSGKEDS